MVRRHWSDHRSCHVCGHCGVLERVLGVYGGARRVVRLDERLRNGRALLGEPKGGAGARPRGGGVGFENDLRATLGQLNNRMTTQMEDINKRLYDLEKSVFKEASPDDDPGKRRE